MASWTVERGFPFPFGATLTAEGINFAIASKHATAVTLLLFGGKDGEEQVGSFTLDPIKQKTGEVWHVHLKGAEAPLIYGYKVEGPKEKRSCFDPQQILSDPYAKALYPQGRWGEKITATRAASNTTISPRGVVLAPQPFDWEGDTPLRIPLTKLIIYECHLRGFTQDKSSGVAEPGTYEGMVEKIPHLVDLGVTAVELLPIFAFNECDAHFNHPETKEPLPDVWGYSPLNFFAPMARYSSPTEELAAPLLAFKKLVRELHRAGIAIILDVVYNHTGDASLRGIDYGSYYHLDAIGHPLDFSGCGNSLNGNTTFTKELILTSLRYWVTEMHVDGFRFDLASVLNRGRHGRPLATSPLVELVSQDPILANTIMIAEPWDAAGMYQVGAFYPQEDRWSEWNGKYRDTVRLFVGGIGSFRGEFATRMAGSQDLYGHCRRPTSSINFITAHDGFTLRDLVTYSRKHNEDNGEDNRDGTNDNHSWNCGVEGFSDDETILALREKQLRNFTVALFTAQGVPMFLMGDEYGHTKKGNNNTYNQDNELNWFLWNRIAEERDFYRFFRGMIAFRKRHASLLQRKNFLTPEDISWHNVDGSVIDWEISDKFLAFKLLDGKTGPALYIAFNATGESRDVTVDKPSESRQWHRIVDTALKPPHDYVDEEEGETAAEALQDSSYTMEPYSAIILKAS